MIGITRHNIEIFTDQNLDQLQHKVNARLEELSLLEYTYVDEIVTMPSPDGGNLNLRIMLVIHRTIDVEGWKEE